MLKEKTADILAWIFSIYIALFVTEFFGIILIWAGYRAMTQAQSESIHEAQRATAD